jgi:hypothetical protein
MKHLLPIAILMLLFACKKETVDNIPRLSFTPENKKWLTYSTGQEWKFKNDRGDSLVYRVTQIEHSYLKPEYRDTTYKIIAYIEDYYVKLEAANDSIMLYFYKEYLSGNPDKLRANIRWPGMRGFLVNLAAIETNASFNQKTVNGLTYTTVTPVMPMSDQLLSFTRFDKAYYDQGAGIIEIIDLNGVSWKRI